MTIFEHSFTLIGLVLGLALVEVLSSFVRAVRRRHERPIGLLTPLLATFVIADVTGFWGILWDDRALLPSMWPTLGFGLLLSSMYYAAAAMVFPHDDSQWRDLDAYYMQHKRPILSLMFTSFAALVVLEGVMGRRFAMHGMIQDSIYLGLLACTAFAPWRLANVIGLLGLIALDVWVFAGL